MTPEQIIDFLGAPAHGRDGWYYNLRSVVLTEEPPVLFVTFDGDGRVNSVSASVERVSNDRATVELQLPAGVTFSTAPWKSGTPELRLSMASDLIASRQIIGGDKGTVEGLLGRPDSVYRDVVLRYVVSETSADYMILEFKIGPDGKVASVLLYQS